MAATDQPNILVFVDWYLPGYKAGGPIRSVANMVNRLPFNFSIVTSDRDHMDEAPYDGIETGNWVEGSHGERIMYLPSIEVNRARLKALMREKDYDYIYINSLFSPLFAIMPLRIARKHKGNAQVLLAPRGMLKAGALSQKAGKKKWFLRAAKRIGLFKGILWHATNDQEKKEIIAHFKGAEVKVAPNLVVQPPEDRMASIPKEKGSVKLVSVARVSPEKNVLNALEFIRNARHSLGHVELIWYGTHQDETYLQKCRDRAATIENATITFPGEIEHDAIRRVMRDAHFFYLPTLGENYGHAIVEAFLFGKPVLISNKTPWHGLEEKGVGWTPKLDRNLFSEIINHLLTMDQEEYAAMCQAAREFGREIAMSEKDLQMNKDLFHG